MSRLTDTYEYIIEILEDKLAWIEESGYADDMLASNVESLKYMIEKLTSELDLIRR